MEAQKVSEEVLVRLLVVRPEEGETGSAVDYCVSLTFFPQAPSDLWRWEFWTALQNGLGPGRTVLNWLGRSRVVFRCRLDELVHVTQALEAANRVQREYHAEQRPAAMAGGFTCN